MTAPKGFEVVTLRNGHRAIRHLESGEVMHPSIGPWPEANTLYVEQSRFVDRLSEISDGKSLILYDIGLGAAANAAAALIAARSVPIGQRRPLIIESFECVLDPLRVALGDLVGFEHLKPIRDAATSLITHGEWREPGIDWRLHLGDLEATLPAVQTSASIVFFDPFSPETNPSLWTPDFLSKVRARCADDGTVFTYSAATPTRVSFLVAGFFVGYGVAVGTKKETTVAAVRRESLLKPLGLEWLARWKRSSSPFPHGGLANERFQSLETYPQFRD